VDRRCRCVSGSKTRAQGAPEVAAPTKTSIAAAAAGSDRKLEGHGPWLADANGGGTGEVHSEVTSICWLTANRGADESGLRDGTGARFGKGSGSCAVLIRFANRSVPGHHFRLNEWHAASGVNIGPFGNANRNQYAGSGLPLSEAIGFAEF